ncbi:hypothetical protein B566_EDAN006332 [Ephemera danica]|nr:hypothetical protein B566_EDAN006332 [Ephemera danica]
MVRNASKSVAQTALSMDLAIPRQDAAIMDAPRIGLGISVINVRMGHLATCAACIAMPIVWNTVTWIPVPVYEDANLDGKEIHVTKVDIYSISYLTPAY